MMAHGRRLSVTQAEGRTVTPYAVRVDGPGGYLADGSCRRDLFSYANERTRRGGFNTNARMMQARVNQAQDARLFGPPDPQTRLQTLTQPWSTNRLARNGWRRFPAPLWRVVQPTRSYMWLVATQPIPPGGEIYWDYRNGNVLQGMVHQTQPAAC